MPLDYRPRHGDWLDLLIERGLVPITIVVTILMIAFLLVKSW